MKDDMEKIKPAVPKVTPALSSNVRGMTPGLRKTRPLRRNSGRNNRGMVAELNRTINLSSSDEYVDEDELKETREWPLNGKVPMHELFLDEEKVCYCAKTRESAELCLREFENSDKQTELIDEKRNCAMELLRITS